MTYLLLVNLLVTGASQFPLLCSQSLHNTTDISLTLSIAAWAFTSHTQVLGHQYPQVLT